jgi:hypothetical protein
LITSLDTNSWSSELLTGNGQFIVTGSPETIYIVSNSRLISGVYSFVVLQSQAVPPAPGPGSTFTTVATYTFPNPTQDFDPVVAFDSSTGLLHIIGTRSNPTNSRLTDLIKFTFNTVSSVLTEPIILTQGSAIRDAYDICVVNNGHKVVSVSVTDQQSPITGQAGITSVSVSNGVATIVATNNFEVGDLIAFAGLGSATFLNGQQLQVISVTNSELLVNVSFSNYANTSDTGTATEVFPGQSLLAFELDGSDNVVANSLIVIANSPDRKGSTYSSVSLYSPDGITVQLFYESHPKLIGFQNQLFTIWQINRNNVSVWGVATQLYIFSGRYTDSRLTAVSTSGELFLSQTFWTQSNEPEGITGNLLLGYYSSSTGTWIFNINSGSLLGGSIIQSTLSVSSLPSVTVVYLLQPFDSLPALPSAAAWPIHVANVNLPDLSVTDVPGFYNQLNATWLRGTKSTLDSESLWAVVGETKNGTSTLPVYLSQYNVPPVAALFPSSVTLYRGGAGYEDLNVPPLISGPFTLNGTQTIDADSDPMYFFWSENDSNTQDIFLTQEGGSEAVLTVERAIGGAEQSFTAGMAAVDLFSGVGIAPITAVEITGGIVTFTCNNLFSAAQPYIGFGVDFGVDYGGVSSAQIAVVYGLQTATFLNSQVISILNATSTQVTATWPTTATTYSLTPDSGEMAIIRHPPSFITSVAVSSNVLTIVANNSLAAGEQVMLWGVILNPPSAPSLSQVVGGTFAATVYYISTTYVNPVGETVASSETSISVLAGNVPVVSSPTVVGNATAFNVYIGTVPGQGQLQTTTPVALNTDWTMPNSGLQYGVNSPFVGGALLSEFSDLIVTVISATSTQFEAALTQSNFAAISVSGLFVPQYQYAECQVTVPFNAAPTITMPNSASATITSVALTSYVLTITTNNSFFIGQQILISGLTHATFLNGETLTVASVSSSFFTAAFDGANYASTSDSGVATPTEGWQVAGRGVLSVISPVITGVSDIDDLPSYSWVQLSGTTVNLPLGSTNPTLTVNTSGVDILGESLEFSLTVDDGVNAAVTAYITLQVASYNFTGEDTRSLTRSIWTTNGTTPATISQRNTMQTWSELDISAMYTDLTAFKRTSISNGTHRLIAISPFSVLVYGGINPNMALLRKLLSPLLNLASPWNPSVSYTVGSLVTDMGISYICTSEVTEAVIQELGTPPKFSGENGLWEPYEIVDAVHLENDTTLVLDNVGNLFRYSSAALINNDAPDTTISLSSLSAFSFDKIFCTVSFNNLRILVLSGPDGCTLLEVASNTLAPQGLLEFSLASNLIYGADNVQFVRLSFVEGLRSGLVLLGTIAPLTTAITSLQISSNALIITGNNSFTAGTNFVISGINNPNYTFLNQTSLQTIAATPTTVTASVNYADTPLTVLTGVATSTNAGNTYETLVDLSKGQIVGTWDKSNLKNQFVNTGEFLFTASEEYSGQPSAPVLNTPVVMGTTTVLISWQQIRPDLISSYIIQVSTDGINYTNFMTIGSGYIEEAQLTLTLGTTYYISLLAVNLDGVSASSNVQSVYLGTLTAPTISLISNITSSVVSDGFGEDYGVDFGGIFGYQVTVKWLAQNPGPQQIADYYLQMQIDGGLFQSLATIEGGTNQFYSVALSGGHTYGFQVYALVAAQNSITPTSQVVSITLPLTIVSASLPNGIQNQVYGTLLGSYFGVQLVNQGGVFPYVWQLVSGSLPQGMTVSSTGLISGVPVTLGTYWFTIQVTDSAQPQSFSTQSLLSITVV